MKKEIKLCSDIILIKIILIMIIFLLVFSAARAGTCPSFEAPANLQKDGLGTTIYGGTTIENDIHYY